MEFEQRFEVEQRSLTKALNTFEKVLALHDHNYSAVELDAIKNGKIQKFEYCAELAWKTAKIYLEIKTGNMAMSPKAVYKSLFLNGLIDEGHYKLLFATVEDRNKLSHIYKEEMYDDVYKNLKTHLTALQNLVNVFNRP